MTLPNKVYDYVKYTTTVAIPALSAAYIGLDVAVDGALPYENQVAKIAVVVTTLLGALVLQQAQSYKNSDDRFDGELTINENDTSIIHQLNLDKTSPSELGKRDAITIKVNKVDTALPPPE